MNIISIQPITALVEGNISTVDAIVFTNFSGYDFSGSAGTVNYALGKKDADIFISISQGTCNIPSEIVASWGADDSVITDYVINQKGFVKV